MTAQHALDLNNQLLALAKKIRSDIGRRKYISAYAAFDAVESVISNLEANQQFLQQFRDLETL